jgi:hypothetical protein
MTTMRVFTTGLLAGAALLSIAACNKQTSAPATTAQAGSATAAPAAPAAGPITADALPHRKPGLWRQTMAVEGMNQAMPAVEMCVDAVSETKMALLGQQMSKDRCKPPQLSRNLDGSISFTGDCDFGAGGRTQTKGTMSGDFNSSYKTVIESTHVGGAGGPGGADHKMTITATWVGACAAGQKGGDVIMPGGQKMNFSSGQ